MNNKGYIVIEALIAIVVLTLVVLSVLSSMSFLTNRTKESEYEYNAGLLLQQGMEVAHGALTSSWDSYEEGNYVIAFDSIDDEWILIDADVESDIQTRFTRKITLSYVCRDSGTGEILSLTSESCAGEIDTKSKNINTQIEWVERTGDVTLNANLLMVNLTN